MTPNHSTPSSDSNTPTTDGTSDQRAKRSGQSIFGRSIFAPSPMQALLSRLNSRRPKTRGAFGQAGGRMGRTCGIKGMRDWRITANGVLDQAGEARRAAERKAACERA